MSRSPAKIKGSSYSCFSDESHTIGHAKLKGGLIYSVINDKVYSYTEIESPRCVTHDPIAPCTSIRMRDPNSKFYET